ncbi:hypothetical protein F5I97DRAFT_1873303, partial [Phlebopus sp. FC_14]
MIAASTSPVTHPSKKRKRNNEDDSGLLSPKALYEVVELAVQAVPTTVTDVFEFGSLITIASAASIRGRDTVASAVHRNDSVSEVPKVRVALNKTWRDIARKSQRDMDVLEIHETELRRPVGFFWSVHDFVLGLRGALLGHEYLVKIHILHRDASENNVVFACDPHQPRGCLVDFDTAIRYTAPEQVPSTDDVKLAFQKRTGNPTSQESHKGPFKAERTGKQHTHYDDIESFFYVLLLFFISYKGPLPTSDLDAAHRRGFSQVLGSGR